MSAALHLCTSDDLDTLAPLVARFHDGAGIARSDEQRRDALMPLLDGSPHGAVYLIGPRRSPVGYIVITFGYSVAFGGIDGYVDEFFIRSNVRGRGMGSEVLASLLPALAENGVVALSLHLPKGNRAQKLFTRSGFRALEDNTLMSRVF